MYILNTVMYMSLVRRFLVRMVGFSCSLVRQSLLITRKYRQYRAITVLHTFQFTAAHALGFPVSTSRFSATDLDEQTMTVLHSKCYK
jgi:hypothetical protein